MRRLASALLLVTCTAALGASSKAGPLQIGVSHQVQVGWVQSSQSGTRLTRLLEQGAAGQNIKPASADGTFQLTGSPFQQDNPDNSFDYRSILRDTTTVSDVQSESLSVYATQSNTYNTINTPALGYFQEGNAVMSSFGP